MKHLGLQMSSFPLCLDVVFSLREDDCLPFCEATTLIALGPCPPDLLTSTDAHRSPVLSKFGHAASWGFILWRHSWVHDSWHLNGDQSLNFVRRNDPSMLSWQVRLPGFWKQRLDFWPCEVRQLKRTDHVPFALLLYHLKLSSTQWTAPLNLSSFSEGIKGCY